MINNSFVKSIFAKVEVLLGVLRHGASIETGFGTIRDGDRITVPTMILGGCEELD